MIINYFLIWCNLSISISCPSRSIFHSYSFSLCNSCFIVIPVLMIPNHPKCPKNFLFSCFIMKVYIMVTKYKKKKNHHNSLFALASCTNTKNSVRALSDSTGRSKQEKLTQICPGTMWSQCTARTETYIKWCISDATVGGKKSEIETKSQNMHVKHIQKVSLIAIIFKLDWMWIAHPIPKCWYYLITTQFEHFFKWSFWDALSLIKSDSNKNSKLLS